MYAHLYKQSSRVENSLGWILIINESFRPVGGVEFQVSGKKQAREIAKNYNAKAWNF